MIQLLLTFAVLLAVSYSVWRLHRTRRILQYLFFCRYPALLAVTLVLLPIASVTFARGYIGNWFSDIAWPDAAVLVFFVLLASRVGWTLIEIVMLGGGNQFDLAYVRSDPPKSAYHIARCWPIAFATITILSWLTAFMVNSRSVLPLLGGTVLGVGATIGIARMTRVLSGRSFAQKLHAKVTTRMKSIQRPSGASPEESDALVRTFRQSQAHVAYTLAFFILLYGLFMVLGNPEGRWPELLPIPAYPLMLLVMGAIVLTIASYHLDVRRVPVLPVVVAYSCIAYCSTNEDHVYGARSVPKVPAGLETWEPSTKQRPLQETNVADQWLLARDMENGLVPVVVTASGGGISAAFWSAAVLAFLQEEDPDRTLPRSLLATSAVSGGSVGLAFYLQEFDAGPPDLSAVETARERAGKSSLAAVAWGLAYPDFHRMFVPFLVADRYDRGWALERAWKEQGLRDDSTLRRWRHGVARGTRPTAIFNATMLETGQRMLIATHDLSDPEISDAASPCGWLGLYPDCDLRIATAARLSASFPYVSPASRPVWRGDDPQPDCLTPATSYHLQDGGYYDNDGVASALDFLDRAIPALAAGGVRKIVLLRIRAGEVGQRPEAKEGQGWISAILGPLKTMLNARGASQVDRNRYAINKFIPFWEYHSDWPIDVYDVVFELSEQASLSWHLTEHERELILAELSQERLDELTLTGDQLELKQKALSRNLKQRDELWNFLRQREFSPEQKAAY